MSQSSRLNAQEQRTYDIVGSEIIVLCYWNLVQNVRLTSETSAHLRPR
jgi:hypothetical protein